MTYDRAAYKRRNVVECSFNVLKQWRSLATRYDKLALTYRSAVVLHAVPDLEHGNHRESIRRHALGPSGLRRAGDQSLPPAAGRLQHHDRLLVPDRRPGPLGPENLSEASIGRS